MRAAFRQGVGFSGGGIESLPVKTRLHVKIVGDV